MTEMRTAHQLARILASKNLGGIKLTIETDTGQIFCVAATDEQAGALVAEIDGLQSVQSESVSTLRESGQALAQLRPGSDAKAGFPVRPPHA
jgi:hypothetical protein